MVHSRNYRRAGHASLALLLLVPAMVAERSLAGSPEDRARRAVVGVLTGRSEPRRLQMIRSFATNPIRRVAAVEAIAEAAKLQAEAAAERKQIPVGTFELIHLLGKIDRPQSHSCLIDLLEAERTELVMTVIDVLGEQRCFDAIEPLKKQVEHPAYRSSYGFRFNLVRALVRMKHPDAIEFLGSLEKEFDGQLRHETTKMLDEVTVENFRGDEQRFLEWQRDTGRAASETKIRLTTNSGSVQRVRLAKSHYYGIPIHAKRMIFVIDCSGSMNAPTYHGTRWSEAKRELMRGIEPLPSDSEFTIIAFHKRVLPWRTELMVASDENKKKAMQFIARLRPTMATNTYGALREAMQLDDNLEAMFVLSDGCPNRGEISQPSRIVRDISWRNRFHHLNISTIGISMSGDAEAFMRRLAENNAGVFRAVD